MVVELVRGFTLRQATAEDHQALLAVCLQTGDSGADATGMDADSDVIGLYFAVPYQVLEPQHCFVISHDDAVCGYVIGCVDTASFERRFESEWLPQLRERVSQPPADAASWKGFDWVRQHIHHPQPSFNAALTPYPAQAHIDLLPVARGKGVGRSALLYLMGRLAEGGARGVHLQVSPSNFSALAFYRSLGFNEFRDASPPEHTVFMVKEL